MLFIADYYFLYIIIRSLYDNSVVIDYGIVSVLDVWKAELDIKDFSYSVYFLCVLCRIVRRCGPPLSYN